MAVSRRQILTGGAAAGVGLSVAGVLPSLAVFEVMNAGSVHQLPEPIKAFGRYEHEALAVDPTLKHVYLSEDASGPNGLFYRWTAPHGVRRGRGLANSLGGTAGTLEAMQIRLDDGSPTYSEFTGPTFSPDGKVLFVNIQVPGITLAITGPWENACAESDRTVGPTSDGPTVAS